MKILVVGGAGYIGSHMVLQLLDQGHEVIVLDDLSCGYADALPHTLLQQGSIADKPLLDVLFKRHQFDAVMHFAAFIQIGESVANPAKYYRNNVVNTLNLFDVMLDHDVRQFVFSSTAAVFGEPEYIPIDNQHPTRPINPYGRSKLMVEQILQDYDKAYGLRSVCLRYFNAAGADRLCRVGERHEPETHLIPLILQVAAGRRDAIKVFGRDYDTQDGTCIRDYIHVEDLCSAHTAALMYLAQGNVSKQFNLGNGQGFSVQQVIDVARAITGQPIKVIDVPRRAGDPARLVADAQEALTVLGWQPNVPQLTQIIAHAWAWEQKYFN